MRFIILIFSFLWFHVALSAQTYTNYFTGNTTDTITSARGGICMMGGASENDEAMKWFLHGANGGDVLVLRTSGSDGYNDYMYESLGVPINSVESIVCHSAEASNDIYLHQKIKNAEAIWFAGGDQWKYVSFWRNTPIDSLINEAIIDRNIVIGGTSAGMAIQGGFYFSAKNGTVTSATALANPYHERITVDSNQFIKNDLLQDVITDTHYDDPDRKGRHVTFLARIFTDYGVYGKGIACEEYTAVCIAPNGIARVYGDYPSENDFAYFIQSNCGIADNTPEVCQSETPLEWNRGGEALKVYKVPGIATGGNTFDLTVWEAGHGGTWEDWSVQNGLLNIVEGDALDCSGLSSSDKKVALSITISPNPSYKEVKITSSNNKIISLSIIGINGQLIFLKKGIFSDAFTLDISSLLPGHYFVQIVTAEGNVTRKLTKK